MGNNIEIVEYKTGVDLSENRMDTKLVVLVNGDRLVIHSYNSTQNIMVQGKNFAKFAVNHLQPYFSRMIDNSLDKIEKFNADVQEALGKK